MLGFLCLFNNGESKVSLPFSASCNYKRLELHHYRFPIAGCEFCGELSDFVKNDLRRFYPKLAPLVRTLATEESTSQGESCRFPVDAWLWGEKTDPPACLNYYIIF